MPSSSSTSGASVVAAIRSEMALEQKIRCLWCDETFAKRQSGGKEQRFCAVPCRVAFHHALHSYAAQEFAEGRVTIEELQSTP